ncbi:MAG: hypothetical protein KJP25_04440 [Gammaproteobacteria bacterium]|nr:hypothetical protein [Gammaproteobacteria bacterium]MBT8151535.1 hypothetical protein [Gammaproteobacteria bacterium]NND39844.1 hypothetical protein [Pseudomonadales bacterium]NNM11150.1 hypothetical protein [Pseudomonadales bacterium]RZV49164.1 MAG: hypothetical protein EX270_13090 [Pseudomonadales bacterium]
MSETSGENSAEAWLLPELGDAQVVQTTRRNAGFSAAVSAPVDAAQTQHDMSSRAPLTRSRLDELARQAREQGHDNGRAEGYQKGYAEGEARAREVVLEQGAQQREQLASLLNSLTVDISASQQGLQAALIEIVHRIARAVCLRELGAAGQQSIATITERTLQALPLGEQHVVLHFHPDDLELIQQQPGLVKPAWQLIADETLGRGDVRVESEFSQVDASVEQRLANIIAAAFDESSDGGEQGL